MDSYNREHGKKYQLTRVLHKYSPVIVISACIVAPIIIGASCPPPSGPLHFPSTSNPITIATTIPDCTPGWVCISIVNTTTVSAEVTLYTHDGYDPTLQFPFGISLNCCPNIAVAQNPCPCPGPGYQVGELQLMRPQLFQAGLIHPIEGQNIRTIQPRESVLVEIQAGDIKSFGIEAGKVGTLPANPEIQDGPYYRCTMIPFPEINDAARAPEDVPSGETFQFVLVDKSNNASPGLTRFTTQTGASVTECPPIMSQ